MAKEEQKAKPVADQQSFPQRRNGQTPYWIVKLESVELLFLHGPTMLDRPSSLVAA